MKSIYRKLCILVAIHAMSMGGEWTNPSALVSQAIKIADELIWKEQNR